MSTPSSSASFRVPFTVRDRRRKGFFTIDNELLDRFGADLGPYGLAVYMALARFANQDSTCWPSLATIAQRTGMSRRQVIRKITHLQSLELIAIEAQIDEETGEHKANLYTLLDMPGSDTQSPGSDTQSPKQNTKNKPQHRNKIQRTTLAVENQDDNNRSDSPERKNVVVALTNQGIAEKVAQRLTSHYSPARIEEKIDYLLYLQEKHPEKVKNPTGWLRRAIEEDYGPPDGYKSQAERDAETVAQQHQEEEMQLAFDLAQRHAEEARERQQQQAAAQHAHLEKTYGTTSREFDLWRQCLDEFKATMPEATFQSCVADTLLLALQDGEALIGLPNPGVRDWVENRLTRKIERILSSYSGVQKVTVKFIVLDKSGARASVA